MSAQIIPLSSAITDLTPLEVIQMDGFRELSEASAVELLRVYDTFCDIVVNILGRESAHYAAGANSSISITEIIQAA